MSNEKLPTQEMLDFAKANRREPPKDTVFDYFTSADGEQIRFARFPASNVLDIKGTVIFIPGRTEFIEKFVEDVHIFNALGFACAAMDLRGQGMSASASSRPLKKHYVRSFDPHLEDLKAFFDKVMINKMEKPYILWGHSAGSHVILRFLKEHPEYADAAITVAPDGEGKHRRCTEFYSNRPAWLMRHLGMGGSLYSLDTRF